MASRKMDRPAGCKARRGSPEYIGVWKSEFPTGLGQVPLRPPKERSREIGARERAPKMERVIIHTPHPPLFLQYSL